MQLPSSALNQNSRLLQHALPRIDFRSILTAFVLTQLIALDSLAHETPPAAEPTITNLRCEDLVDPIGIDVFNPRLSWQMQSTKNGAAQSAYQVLVATSPKLLTEGSADLWDSGKITTNQSQHVVYQGKIMGRGKQHYWTVRIWNENGKVTPWSTPSVWTLFDMPSNHDWQAQWITEGSSSPWLRTSFDILETPSRAFIYVNAIGYFQLFINGKKVSNDEFAPHVGQYNKRTFCITYDVTPYLKNGKNAIGVWMGSGWSKGGAGIRKNPSVRAQLEIEDSKGTIKTIVTDTTWRAIPSSMTYRGSWAWNKFGGEIHNGSMDQPAWADANLDDNAWPNAKTISVPSPVISAEMLQRNRVIETLQPVSVTKLEKHVITTNQEASNAQNKMGKKNTGTSNESNMEQTTGESYLVNMGKAMTGTFEITFPNAPKDHKISMIFGDSINGNQPNSFSQASEYICRGSGIEMFKNRFNYASCQYILIHNVPPGEFNASHIKGFLITTDLPKASTFDCSDQTLNQVYQMIDHTLRCLMLGGYQVDCHSRERYGYGGDGHASLDTTLSLLRSDAFYRKWTRDWLDGQADDGGFSYTSPTSTHGGGPFWSGFLTAATLKHYQHYGDISMVRRNYPAIKKWLEMAQSKTENNLQMKFCGSWYLGDWASPKGVDDENNAEAFILPYMAYAMEQGAQLADALHESDDAATFRKWAADRNAATHRKLYNPDKGYYGTGQQVTSIAALIAGTVPEELHDTFFARFEKGLMSGNQGHLATGLSGTYLMIRYLQNIGRDDLIYAFASKRTYPSWGYMIENGATATWEYWNGKASRIHNCYNSIGSWFIEGVAGIRPDPQKPGYQNAIIKPAYLKELNYTNGSHHSIYGTITSNWKRQDNSITLTVKVPANSTASVYLPSTTSSSITVNSAPAITQKHVTFRNAPNGQTIADVQSGTYVFVCQ